MSHPSPPSPAPSPSRSVEVAIIGGGPAGLSAALVLGRARRSVLVIDAGRPGHFAADAVHGFLGMENVPPRELRRRVWEQLEPFDVSLVQAGVVGSRPEAGAGIRESRGAVAVDSGFVLTLDDGSTVEAAVVLLATGVHYGVMDLPGLAALWGERLFHCPFCHGWEVVGKRVGVIGPQPVIDHMVPLIRLWADDLTGFLVGPTAGGGPTAVSVSRDGDDGTGDVVVALSDGSEVRVDVLFAPPALGPVDALLEDFGLHHDFESPMTPEPLGLAVDANGATAVRGVYAAGDFAGELPSVANAVQSGSKAAVGIVRLLSGQG
ncbi:MAG: NAD(P)/FAD-dependent oxidoreductase [Solirubrobacteraceae bacterium]|nr:NAD(P)/FAD-dependent oxidoreductase [Solirubrobacteraceae bacterium]